METPSPATGSGLIDRFSQVLARVTAGMLIVMMLLITTEVVARLLDTSTRVADEFSGYLMVVLSFWGAAEVVRARRHIRVTAFTDHLSLRVQSVLDIANHALAFILVAVLLWAATQLVLTSLSSGAITTGVYQIKRWVPQAAIPIGLLFLTLQIGSEIPKLLRARKDV